jgi:hypothetical protein
MTPEQQAELAKLEYDARIVRVDDLFSRIEGMLENMAHAIEQISKVCDYCRGKGVKGHCVCPTKRQ